MPENQDTPSMTLTKHGQGRVQVLERFGPYRKPTDVTIPKYQRIQEMCQVLALLIYDTCPDSQQKSTALTQLEMAKMSANAAIAIHTPS